MPYDTSALDRDGALRKRLRKQLAEVNARLADEVPRARAGGVTIAQIMAKTDYAQSWIQKLVAQADERDTSTQ